MSAPDVRAEMTSYVGVCPYCHDYRTLHYANDLDAEADVRRHQETCPALALARLQGRLRGLVAQWRTEAGRIGTGRIATSYAAGRIDCADELTRAIGDET